MWTLVVCLALAGMAATAFGLLRWGNESRRLLESQSHALAAAERRADAAERHGAQADLERQSLARSVRELALATQSFQSAEPRRIPEILLGLVGKVLEPRRALVAIRRRATVADPGRVGRLIVVAAIPPGGPVAPGVEIPIGRGEIGFAAEVQRVMDRHDLDYLAPGSRLPAGEDPVPGFRADLVAPLVADERTVGVVALAEPRWSPPEAKEVLRLMAYVAAGVMHHAVRYDEMRLTASLDSLTGALNKGHVTARLSEVLGAARRSGEPFSIVLFDIDNFKHYNDRNGHPAGDQLLRTLASLVQEHLRREAVFGRFGGEEFLVLLPGIPRAKALAAAYNIRRVIAGHPFEFAAAQPLGCISVSGGVATFPEDGEDSVALLRAADEALYDAKRSGRNRILSAPVRTLA